MKYKFINKEGKEIEAIPERWAWGVIYKAKKESIEKAEKETKERNEKLITEMNERIEKVNGDPKAVENLENYFEKIFAKPIETEQKELKQFGDDGIFHQFGEIEQDKIEMFVMYKMDMSKRVDMVVEGKQIFHFYRNIVLYAGKSFERRIKIYCFGYKNKNTGETAYHFILPDDRIVIGDKDLDLTQFDI